MTRTHKNALLAIAALFLGACSSSSNDDPGVNPNPGTSENPFTVYGDVTDPRIVSAIGAGGEEITYYGTRDADGVPENIDLVTVTTPSGMETIELDAEGRPERVLSPSGVEFLLEWQPNGTSAVLTALSADGETQITTLVDFLAPPSAPSPGYADGPIVDRLGLPSAGAELDPPIQILGAGAEDGPTSGVVETFVTDCGLPRDNVQVLVYVYDQSNGESIGAFPAQNVGTGLFRTTIPTGQQYTPQSLENCQAIEAALGYICLATEGLGPAGIQALCLQLAASGSASGPGAAAILAACEASVVAIELYCSTLGASPAPGAPSLLEQICNAAFSADPVPAELRVQSCVVALPSNVCSAPVIMASTGSTPGPLVIDMGSDTAIRTLTLSPSNPSAGQSYVATADISCLPAGTVVDLSIVGTDGYTDSVSFLVQTSQPEGMYQLSVPGAAVGVHDTVTCRVTPPSGSPLVRVATLVFG